MTKLKCLLLFTFFAAINQYTLAQEILSNNPTSTKWKQIKTPGFKIIFPEGFEQSANEVANTLEHIREPETNTMGKKNPKRISIILQRNNAVSNGFVTLGPRRSEFYTMPPQDYNFAGTNKWLSLLAVHEYRHIVQFQRSRTGLNKAFSILFGENTQAGMAFAAAPRWFWEGDATLMETAVTSSGRGRIPSFDRVFRTNLLSGKRFNYNKQHLQSFKDYIPDHYKLGYYFTAHLRKRTKNPEIWNDIAKSAFNAPIIPFTFSNAMKKHTGIYLVENFNMMMDDLENTWSEQIADLQPSSYETINRRENDVFTEYAFPQTLEDGSIVIYKTGLGDVGQLVRYDSEGNQIDRVVTGVNNNTGMLTSTQYKVYWNEYEFDPRWRAKSYSVIKSYDFATGDLKRITKKTRYSGAGISPDGYRLVAIENDLENKNNIVILDAISGNVIKKFSNDTDAQYGMPCYSADGESVVMIKITETGKSVISINVETGAETTLIEESNENIGYPVLTDQYLFYNSPFNGIDNIYVLELTSKRRFQITKSKFGAYNPNLLDDKTLVYNEHTPNGLDIVKAELAPDSWTPLENVVDRNVRYYEEIVEQEGHADLLSGVPDKQYETKNYSKLGHAVNIHSWGPFASTDVNNIQAGIYSQDVLSTTKMSVGYAYDVEEETGYASAKFSYQGLYPIFDLEIQKGNRTSNEGVINGEELIFDWKEEGALGELTVPLLLTRSKYNRQLNFSAGVGYTDVYDFENSVLGSSRLAPVNDTLAFFFRDVQSNGKLFYNKLGLTFNNFFKRNSRDILSQWGQSITLESYKSAYDSDFEGRLFALRMAAFFPSPLQLINKNIFKHHVLNFRYGYQNRLGDLSSNLYYFRNRINKPRGYSYPLHDEFASFSANYTFPLIYPDIALGPFLNIQRIRANAFMDFGRGIGKNYFVEYQENDPRVFFNSNTEDYQSIGVEVLIDFNVLRFPTMISTGIRYSYLTTTNETNLEFVVIDVSF